jgi:DNA-binding NarL/FixJ family response regulator
MIRILVADDHAVVREGVRRILADTTDLRVVGEACTGPEVIAQVATQPLDIVLLDISLPGRNGLDVLQHLKHAYPTLHALIFSMHPEQQYAVRALKAGAAGYLTKDSLPDELVTAVRQVARGGRYINSALAEHLFLEVTNGGNEPLHTRLSDREYQVLCLLAGGHTITTIATELALSVKTVSTYRTRILEKLQLKTTASLIHYAIRHRLID